MSDLGAIFAKTLTAAAAAHAISSTPPNDVKAAPEVSASTASQVVSESTPSRSEEPTNVSSLKNTQDSVPATAISQPAINLCIGDVCIGKALNVYYDRIDNSMIADKKSIYQDSFSSCEKQRILDYNKAKELLRVYGRQPLIIMQVQSNASSQKCVDAANEAAHNYEDKIAYGKSTANNFLRTWGRFENSDSLSLAASRHPESYLSLQNSEYGREMIEGVLKVRARTNLGSFVDFEKASLICQPILTFGSLDKGDVNFVALFDQESHKFIIVSVSATLENLSPAQVQSAENQYIEKFGEYINDRRMPESAGDYRPDDRALPVRYGTTSSAFSLEITMPIFRGMEFGDSRMPPEFKSVFSYVKPTDISDWNFDQKEDYRVGLVKDYLHEKSCQTIINKASGVTIK